MWTRKTNKLFSASDRERVRLILCIQKRTQFVTKDVLFAYIIPNMVGNIIIPKMLVNTYLTLGRNINIPQSIDEPILRNIIAIPNQASIKMNKISKNLNILIKMYSYSYIINEHSDVLDFDMTPSKIDSLNLK